MISSISEVLDPSLKSTEWVVVVAGLLHHRRAREAVEARLGGSVHESVARELLRERLRL
jgi:hypothetical protein